MAKRIIPFEIIIVFFTYVAAGQNGFEPAANIPVAVLGDKSNYVIVQGHWVEHDDQHRELAGPSTSTITCINGEKICVEEQANLVNNSGIWILTAEHLEYKIDRWDSQELVAHKDPDRSAACKVRITLRFDFTLNKIYWLQSLSEPPDESIPKPLQYACSMSAMSLEMRDGKRFLSDKRQE